MSVNNQSTVSFWFRYFALSGTSLVRKAFQVNSDIILLKALTFLKELKKTTRVESETNGFDLVLSFWPYTYNCLDFQFLILNSVYNTLYPYVKTSFFCQDFRLFG
jgi:hypothetical protein